MTTETQSESAAKKDTQRLQRAIVDGLEDVKAQDVVVFNTEHLSPLFERVIIASGTSNRQTKALAASVRDAVREAGFPKPRIEGEENGEWIIVDCGAAVAHVMQPAIRQYYHLEEIWGDKPVRLKLGSAKPAQPESVKADKPAAKSAKKKPVDDSPNLRRSSAAKIAVKAAEQVAREEKAAAGKSRSRGTAKTAPRSSVRGQVGVAAKSPAKSPAKKSAVKPAGKVLVVNAPSTKKAATKKAAAARSPVKSAGKAPSRAPARAPGRAPAKAPIRKPASRKA